MKSKMNLFAEASPLGFSRFAFAAVAFAALTLCGSVSFAEDDVFAEQEAIDKEKIAIEEEAQKRLDELNKRAEAAKAKAAAQTGVKAEHKHMDPKVPPITKGTLGMKGKTSKSSLASKLANPSAPVMALQSFLDVKQNGGSASGAHRASFQYEFQPAIPFPTKRGNVIFRPAIPIQFGEPYVNAAGTIDTAVAFGNISLDTLYGKTLKDGLMIMGGFNTLFPSNSKPELRADWAIGPEAVLGYASPKTGNVFGMLGQFTWSLPTRAEGQSVALQYFYAVNVGDGWQIAAQPVMTYSRESKVLRFPLGIGLVKVAALGHKNFPVKLGVQVWAYTPPPDASGPEWTIRFTIAPVVKLPWKK
ncbi:MAG: hypothetical protein JRH14_19550 [Deltaproteobacteria bacterium]|nr:hypothetical protein [Deltaproteobacteria bacterium]